MSRIKDLWMETWTAKSVRIVPDRTVRCNFCKEPAYPIVFECDNAGRKESAVACQSCAERVAEKDAVPLAAFLAEAVELAKPIALAPIKDNARWVFTRFGYTIAHFTMTEDTSKGPNRVSGFVVCEGINFPDYLVEEAWQRGRIHFGDVGADHPLGAVNAMIEMALASPRSLPVPRDTPAVWEDSFGPATSIRRRLNLVRKRPLRG